jgi:YD repeat-containing protein
MISFRAMADILKSSGRADSPTTKTARYWSRKRVLTWLAALATVAAIYAVLPSPRKATIKPEDIQRATEAARLDGTYPCVLASVSGDHLVTEVSQCETPTLNRREMDRFEVDLRYGAFILRQSDLFLKDVFDVPLTRSYTSQDWASKDSVHAFGRNSNHPYDIAPLGDHWPYTYIILMLEDSNFIYFKRISEGGGFADAVFMHTESSTPFYKAIFAWNGNGWTLRLADGTEMHFPESYNAKNMAQGATLDLVDAVGNKLTLNRDWHRNLKEIVTPHGRWIRFELDSEGRIVQARDDSANGVQYGYNRDGMLVSANWSSGAARRYEYDGYLMTAVIDEHGRTLVHNSYDKRNVLVGQEFANGDAYRYGYVWGPSNHYVEKVVITLPDHTEREISPAGTVPDYIRTYR